MTIRDGTIYVRTSLAERLTDNRGERVRSYRMRILRGNEGGREGDGTRGKRPRTDRQDLLLFGHAEEMVHNIAYECSVRVRGGLEIS